MPDEKVTRSQAAARARRYRARKRGENVPLRKPGPRAKDWRCAAELEAELRKAKDELADALEALLWALLEAGR